jgi:methionyl-tRNA formyltransferase
VKILCVGYRDWALRIYNELKIQIPEHDFIILSSEAEFEIYSIANLNPDLILFYGWSSIISHKLINSYKCIMLHPSKLPEYRGGSPIQNQIINGLTSSAVTLFLMDEDLDAGPILKQQPFSLEGTLDQIFNDISSIGYELTKQILNEGLRPKPQNHSNATYFKRRKPEESEITLKELSEKPYSYLYNKIRMLSDPYPNTYIMTSDKKKLYIQLK